MIPLLPVKKHARAGAELLLDVSHRLIVSRQHHLAPHRLAARVGHRDRDFAGLAGFIDRLVGLERDVEQPLHRRHEQLARLGVDAAVAHERRLHEEIGHVLRLDGQVNHRRPRGGVNEAPMSRDALADLVGEKNARVVLRHIEEQVRRVAELVSALVGDDFQVVEAIDPAVELRSVDPEDRVALHLLLRRNRA